MIYKPQIDEFTCKMGIMREYFRIPNYVTLVARIMGDISKDDLEEILNKLTKVHPLMGVRVLVDDNNEAWFTNKNVAPLSLKVITRKSEEQWVEIIEDEYKIHFDFQNGPLIRFILLKSAEVSDLIIIAQHVICDGISLTNIVKDIIILLSEPDIIFRKIDAILPVAENFPAAKSLRFKWKHQIDKFFVTRLNRQWKKQRVLFDDEDYWTIIEANSQKFNYQIIAAALSQIETSALVNKCRQKDVTVNSAISVAFLAARESIRNYSSNENPRVQIAVNIRNKLKEPAENVFGFLASSISFEYKYNVNEDFWDNVGQFHQEVLEQLTGDGPLEDLIGCNIPTLSEAVNFAVYGKWVSNDFSRYEKINNFIQEEKNMAVEKSLEKIKNMPGLSVSNLGQITLSKKYDNFRVHRLYFAGSPNPFMDLTIGAVTVDGRLSLTQNYMEPQDNNSDNLNIEMKEIMGKAIELLDEAVNKS
jgi:NRPS condensation-like uncharacterized protein